MRSPKVRVTPKPAKNKRRKRYYNTIDHGQQSRWHCNNCQRKSWDPIARCPECGGDVRVGEGRHEEHARGLSFETRREAEEARADLERQLGGGGGRPNQDATLGEFVHDTFLPYHRRRRDQGAIDAGTVKTAETYLTAYVIPRIGHVRLRDLTPTEIDDFNEDLLKAGRVRGTGGLAPKTVRNVAQVVNQVLG